MFSSNPVLSAMLALSITLTLIWLGSKLVTIISRSGAPGFSRRQILSNSPMLTIESVTSIAPRRKVIVLRYGEQRLAVLTGGPQDVSLGWLPVPNGPEGPLGTSFSSLP